MSKPERADLDAYYREAGSWASDRQTALQRSRRLAWICASVAAFVAVAEAIAIIVLTPLKTVVPYTLLVDRQTGYVQALKPLEQQRITPDNALTQSFLVQYVIGRESLSFDTVQSDYRKVTLWSAESARSGYVRSMQVSNPDSPLVRYPRSTLIETRVKSVSPLSRNTALVRFDKIRRDGGDPGRLLGSWAAVVTYRYSGEPMAVEDRYLNPLGFQVTRYRVDAEVLPSTPADLSPPLPVGAPAR